MLVNTTVRRKIDSVGRISGLLVGLAMIGLFVVRTLGEEKLLARDLEGYRAYREKVRYRLMPHVW